MIEILNFIGLGDASAILAMMAIVVPAAAWVIHSLTKRHKEIILHSIKSEEDAEVLSEMGVTLKNLSDALLAHMGAEDRTNLRIEELGNVLLTELRQLDAKQGRGVVGLVQSVSAKSETPTFIHTVTPGDYEFLWANKPYLDLVGLTLEECRAGQYWLSIEKAEREIIKTAAEAVGQAQDHYEGSYTMVNARTQEKIGTAHAEAYVTPGAADSWFYVTQVTVDTNS